MYGRESMNIGYIDDILDAVLMLLGCDTVEEIDRLGDELLATGKFNQAAVLAYCLEKGVFTDTDLRRSGNLWRFVSNCCGNRQFAERSLQVLKMADSLNENGPITADKAGGTSDGH